MPKGDYSHLDTPENREAMRRGNAAKNGGDTPASCSWDRAFGAAGVKAKTPAQAAADREAVRRGQTPPKR